jgi:hypothetical protein
MLDELKARYRTEITLPAEPFEVCSEHGQYLTNLEGQPANSEEANCEHRRILYRPHPACLDW